MKHALHNLSSANIWLDCGAYYHYKVAAEAAGEVYDTSGPAAIRGTQLHEISERALPLALKPGAIVSSCIEQCLNGTEVSAEDFEQMEIAIEATRDLIHAYQSPNSRTGVKPEVVVGLSHEPMSNGYVDVFAINDATMLVIDYKYGQGAVQPNSPQLLGYGANLIDKVWRSDTIKHRPGRVVLAIVQPRLHREALTYETTPKALKKFQGYVEGVVERQKLGDKRGASQLGTCQWCPFKDRCTAYADLAMGVVSRATDAEPLSPEDIEQIVRSKAAINKLVADCTEQVVNQPETYPNWTRAQVTNARSWNASLDTEQLAHELRLAGVEDPYVISTPAKLKDQYPEAAPTIDELSIDRGFHVRLREGAPKAGVAPKEPAKRPQAKEPKPAPKEVVKATRKPKKVAAKKAAPKKAAARKKAAPKRKRATK